VWVSGDEAAAAAMLDSALPVSDPPWTEQAARILAHTRRGAGRRGAGGGDGRASRQSGRSTSSPPPSSRVASRAGEAHGRRARGHCPPGAVFALLLPGFREGRRLARLNAEIARIDPQLKTVERAARELERKRQLLATLEKVGSGPSSPCPCFAS
jgi:hypothetical protein